MNKKEEYDNLNFMVSPLTNTIYMSKIKPLKKEGQFVSIGTKVDVTDKVIKTVFEWFMAKAKYEEGKHYQISFGENFGTLTYTTKKELNK